MPEELGNLLVRISSVGFDEVYEQLQSLDEVMSKVGSNSAFSTISKQLDQMSRYMKDMHGDLGQLTLGQEKNAKAAESNATAMENSAQKIGALDKVFKSASATAAIFWAVASVPRKFLDSMSQISAFNVSLTNMAISANMSRESLNALGVAVEGFGGTKSGLASAAAGFQSAAQGLRTGRGGGNLVQAASLYGLNIFGSGESGLATQTELFKNIADLFEKMGDSESAMNRKLDLKAMLGLDEGTFRLLNMGTKAYEEELGKSTARQKEMSSAVEASNRITARRKELDLLYADIQLKMLEAGEPFLNWIIDVATWFGNLAKESPGVSLSLKTLGEVATAAGAAFAGWKILMATMGIGKALSSAGQIAGGIAGGIGNAAGGVAGGIGKSVGGIGASVVDLVSGTVQRQIQIHSLSVMEQVLDQWHREWLAITVRSNLSGEQVSTSGFYKLLGNNIDESTKNLFLRASQNAYEMNSFAREVNRDEYRRRNSEARGDHRQNVVDGNGGRSIQISNIDISVSSSSSDAEEVAKAVREELFRQINKSIEDAVYGSKVL